ncbi:MAG: AMP-binding protein [Proteobacteria bacterium]|nr:AMP-binding protein [Pseudomonadota bacterium]
MPVGVKGELYIGGDGVARGYHQRPELTAQRFIDIGQTGIADTLAAGAGRRLYRTGDVVRYLEDGNLVYLGRVDNQVKVRGFRVELGEIESVLAHQPGVREAVVIAHRRSEQDVRLIAYVTATEGALIDERNLRQALAEVLPAHMLPNAFKILPSMPLTGNGKVDRAALPLPEGSRSELSASFVDPGNDAERHIAGVWRELLDVERVGAEDNFFELGGHSLLVLPLRDRLQALFGRAISPVDIFRLPTVASQARFLTGAETAPASDSDDARRQAQRQRDALRQMKGKRQKRV